MTVTIHQPCYVPYLGIFYKIWSADRFVFLDDAQYSNGYVFDWNRIKIPSGETRIKIPTEKSFPCNLNDVRTRDELGWKEKHLKTLRMNYSRARYFNQYFPEFEQCLMKSYGNLSELNEATMLLVMKLFGFEKPVHYSSDMNIEERSEARVIRIVKEVGGDVYLSGTGGKGYQKEEDFTSNGIKLVYNDYKPLEYRQLWGDFLPNMSVLDFVFNEGPDIDSYFKRIKEASCQKN